MPIVLTTRLSYPTALRKQPSQPHLPLATSRSANPPLSHRRTSRSRRRCVHPRTEKHRCSKLPSTQCPLCPPTAAGWVGRGSPHDGCWAQSTTTCGAVAGPQTQSQRSQIQDIAGYESIGIKDENGQNQPVLSEVGRRRRPGGTPGDFRGGLCFSTWTPLGAYVPSVKTLDACDTCGFRNRSYISALSKNAGPLHKCLCVSVAGWGGAPQHKMHPRPNPQNLIWKKGLCRCE